MCMNILIDECLPKKLKQELRGHTIFTVREKGCSGIENGDKFYKPIVIEIYQIDNKNLFAVRIGIS